MTSCGSLSVTGYRTADEPHGSAEPAAGKTRSSGVLPHRCERRSNGDRRIRIFSVFQILICRAGDHEIKGDCRTFGAAKYPSARHLERSVAESKPEGQMRSIWISRKNQYPLTNKGEFSYLRDPTYGFRLRALPSAQDDNARVIPRLSDLSARLS